MSVMRVKDFLEAVFFKAPLRFIDTAENGKMTTAFVGVRDEVPESLHGKKVEFFDVEIDRDIEDPYVLTAGIRVFIK